MAVQSIQNTGQQLLKNDIVSYISIRNIIFNDNLVQIFIPDIIKSFEKASLQPKLL